MPAFLIPIISGFLVALSGLVIRYLEKKVLKLDSAKIKDAITEAQVSAKNPVTIGHLADAKEAINNLDSNLNMKFASKSK